MAVRNQREPSWWPRRTRSARYCCLCCGKHSKVGERVLEERAEFSLQVRETGTGFPLPRAPAVLVVRFPKRRRRCPRSGDRRSGIRIVEAFAQRALELLARQLPATYTDAILDTGCDTSRLASRRLARYPGRCSRVPDRVREIRDEIHDRVRQLVKRKAVNPAVIVPWA